MGAPSRRNMGVAVQVSWTWPSRRKRWQNMASVWVPFTSESKEAVAHYPEIIKEIKLALQECGRKLAVFVRRRRKAVESERKKAFIQQYIPHIAIALREMLDLSDRQEKTMVRQLTDVLERSRS